MAMKTKDMQNTLTGQYDDDLATYTDPEATRNPKVPQYWGDGGYPIQPDEVARLVMTALNTDAEAVCAGDKIVIQCEGYSATLTLPVYFNGDMPPQTLLSDAKKELAKVAGEDGYSVRVHGETHVSDELCEVVKPFVGREIDDIPEIIREMIREVLRTPPEAGSYRRYSISVQIEASSPVFV
jgi:hypothetical protein